MASPRLAPPPTATHEPEANAPSERSSSPRASRRAVRSCCARLPALDQRSRAPPDRRGNREAIRGSTHEDEQGGATGRGGCPRAGRRASSRSPGVHLVAGSRPLDVSGLPVPGGRAVGIEVKSGSSTPRTSQVEPGEHRPSSPGRAGRGASRAARCPPCGVDPPRRSPSAAGNGRRCATGRPVLRSCSTPSIVPGRKPKAESRIPVVSPAHPPRPSRGRLPPSSVGQPQPASSDRWSARRCRASSRPVGANRPG